jgi:hypothetical protein
LVSPLTTGFFFGEEQHPSWPVGTVLSCESPSRSRG